MEHKLAALLLLVVLLVGGGLARPQQSAGDGEGADLDTYDQEEDEYEAGLDAIPEDEEADEEHAAFFEDGGEEEDEDQDIVGTSAGGGKKKVVKEDEGPANYSAVDDGLVLPPGNRGDCKALDVVYASTTAIEACYAKITGQLVDLSEQLLIDCAVVGPKKSNSTLCSRPGLSAQAYLEWVTKNKIKLSAEKDYPNKVNQTSSCPATLPPPPTSSTGARIKQAIYTTSAGTEKKMREMVATYGAVLTTIWANDAYRKYKGGVFAGCKKGDKAAVPNHVVAVVGFGKDATNGKAYWLVKNSRGEAWGEKGYVRIERGVGMCGIGKALSVVECEAVAECTAGDEDCEEENNPGGKSGDYENYDKHESEDEDEEEESK